MKNKEWSWDLKTFLVAGCSSPVASMNISMVCEGRGRRGRGGDELGWVELRVLGKFGCVVEVCIYWGDFVVGFEGWSRLCSAKSGCCICLCAVRLFMLCCCLCFPFFGCAWGWSLKPFSQVFCCYSGGRRAVKHTCRLEVLQRFDATYVYVRGKMQLL